MPGTWGEGADGARAWRLGPFTLTWPAGCDYPVAVDRDARDARLDEVPGDATAEPRPGPEPLPASYIPRRERGASRRAGH